LRRFVVLGRWLHELICRACLELEGEEGEKWDKQ